MKTRITTWVLPGYGDWEITQEFVIAMGQLVAAIYVKV
jgi:hypothetical protein